jgi:L-ascorbate metabolism protein UlaG (beta-lactamase superfamily)
VKIKWFGHACFKLTSQRGVSVITDPFDQSVGYDLPGQSADVITVSHDHYDHNYVEGVRGVPLLINKVGEFHIKDVAIRGIKTWHDEMGGAKRGENIVFNIRMDDINICHLGDLGHMLSQEQVADIGAVDVLLVPVGGIFTVDKVGAMGVIQAIKPRMVIPMHYRTDVLTFKIDTIDPFLEIVGDYERHDTNEIELNNKTLPSDGRVVVLNYK